MAEWDYTRSTTLTPVRPLPAENPPKPAERLKVLEPLLGHTWNAKGEWGSGTMDAFHVESTFEWILYIDAIYARALALRGNGEPRYVLDAYIYHHTGTNRLRCLALSDGGGVYEGDLTVLDGGALPFDLRGYEQDQVVQRLVRLDFEQAGTILSRVWSLAGAEGKLMLDVRHKRLGSLP
jgi:hypothetical protein